MLKVKVGASTVTEAVNTHIYRNIFPSVLNVELSMQTLHVKYMQFS